MKAATRTRQTDKPSIVHLSSPLNTGTVGEIYDAVRYKEGNAIVRAGKDSPDRWYVYLPKRENKLAATTYKASSIQRHRQQMQDLLLESSDTFNNKDWVGIEQRKMIMMLRHQVMKKDIAHTDFTAREVAATLKPLSNLVRSRKRLEKTSALRAAVSPKLKSRKDYLKQFLNMSDSDLRILNQALFPTEKTFSFKEKKLVLNSIFALIKDYLNNAGNGQTLADLYRRSPKKDLLLKFAKAWTDHIKAPHSGRHPNLLVVFSWQKTMTSVCNTILEAASQPPTTTLELTSPERYKIVGTMMRRSQGVMDGGEPESPTKFPSLAATPVASIVAMPSLVDSPLTASPMSASLMSASPTGDQVALQTMSKFELADDVAKDFLHFSTGPEVTAQVSSVASLPEIDDTDTENIDLLTSQTSDEPQV